MNSSLPKSAHFPMYPGWNRSAFENASNPWSQRPMLVECRTSAMFSTRKSPSRAKRVERDMPRDARQSRTFTASFTVISLRRKSCSGIVSRLRFACTTNSLASGPSPSTSNTPSPSAAALIPPVPLSLSSAVSCVSSPAAAALADAEAACCCCCCLTYDVLCSLLTDTDLRSSRQEKATETSGRLSSLSASRLFSSLQRSSRRS
mmetsp:Transcript_35219/g.69496  ORF Transcript_35219/g.69496 Transcript_35219/m.69496 type:complete len:204 (+) Transcript_35219:1591-2202(+)